jgi:hypothetical protein
MTEKKIKIDIGNDKYVVIRFVLENDMWVARANDEFLNDLESIFGVER